MEYKIEKGVPLTEIVVNNAKYPFAEMEVGDSFLIPNARKNMTAGAITNNYKKRTGKKFAGRREGNGLRVWRIL